MAQFNNDDILVLAKAGFTAEQIAALNAIQTAPAPEPDTAAPAPRSDRGVPGRPAAPFEAFFHS